MSTSKYWTILEHKPSQRSNRRVWCKCNKCGQTLERSLSNMYKKDTMHASCRYKDMNSLAGYKRQYGRSTGYVGWEWRNKDGKKTWLAEHTLVMEKKLGRSLVKGENVHHLNGIRDDNRIDNLELWNTSQPCGQRAKDKLQWAYEIIRLYGEDHGTK